MRIYVVTIYFGKPFKCLQIDRPVLNSFGCEFDEEEKMVEIYY